MLNEGPDGLRYVGRSHGIALETLVLDWLNENSPAVPAAATLILVVVTLSYVLLTQSLARSTKASVESGRSMVESSRLQSDAAWVLAREAEKTRAMVVLPLVVVRHGGGGSDWVEVFVENDGLGPAINVTVQWIGASAGGGMEHIARVLRPSERVKHQWGPSVDLPGPPEPNLVFRSWYGDLLGGLYETTTTTEEWKIQGRNDVGKFVLSPLELGQENPDQN